MVRELSTGLRELSQCPEKANRAFSLLKGPTSTFTIIYLRHYTKLPLNVVSICEIGTLVRKDPNTMKCLVPLTAS